MKSRWISMVGSMIIVSIIIIGCHWLNTKYDINPDNRGILEKHGMHLAHHGIPGHFHSH